MRRIPFALGFFLAASALGGEKTLTKVCDPVQTYLNSNENADKATLADCLDIAKKIPDYSAETTAKIQEDQRALGDLATNGNGQAGTVNDAATAGAAGADASRKLASDTTERSRLYQELMTKANARIKILTKEFRPISAACTTNEEMKKRGEISGKAIHAFVDLREHAKNQKDGLDKLTLRLNQQVQTIGRFVVKTDNSGKNLGSIDDDQANSEDDSAKEDPVVPDAIAPAKAEATRKPASTDGNPADASDSSSSGDGISTNLLVGLGGAAVIGAGVVGGLYWVSQKAISSADTAAAARIAQAQTAANDVINNAQAAVAHIIQLAQGSLNQIIANVQQAGTQIVQQAMSNVDGLISQLTTELGSDFPTLTNDGVQKFYAELQSLFQTLINNANSANNPTLAAALGKTWTSVYGQFSAQYVRRGLAAPVNAIPASAGAASGSPPAGASTGTSTGTSTSTSTATAP